MGHPGGSVPRMSLILPLFRCNAEVVIANLFKVFDPENTGSVVPTELLVAFSMSMKGSVMDKLRWYSIVSWNSIFIIANAGGPSSCTTKMEVGKLTQMKWKISSRNCAKLQQELNPIKTKSRRR